MISEVLFSLALLSLVNARVQFLGISIAGGDFGCEIDGSCPTGSTQLPLGNQGGGDGEGQMKHFVQNDQMNIFRLPISWQFLANNQIGADLDTNNLAKYDQLVQACLATGAYCMIDIHNFARVDGAIIGQGGPSDEQFASLWGELAAKYAAEDKMVFELMNEPHDLDVAIWAKTCQSAVTAIRNAGAKTQMILLPGSNFDSAATLTTAKGGAEQLMGVTNPDGSTDGLLLDIHKYLDEDNSGTHAECVTDNIDAFTAVADFLRKNGRQGIVSETGASSDASCMTAFCSQNTFINSNSDVLIGLVGWGAGSFDSSYLLSLTPSKQGNGFVDNNLAAQCVVKTWQDSSDTVPSFSATRTVGGTGAATRTMTMPGGPTGSSVMTVTMTGTAISEEPTTLLMAPGAPSLSQTLSSPAGGSASAPPLTSPTGNTPSPTGGAEGNMAERLQLPSALFAIGLAIAVMLN